jgi:hypothetical protein
MEFNEENCLKVSNLFDKNNDDEEVYIFFMNLINKYFNKYNKLDNIEITNDFKRDTKNIISLGEKIFCKDEIIKELENENYDDNEYDEYLELVENIKYINKNFNLLDENYNEIKNKILSVCLFFLNKENDLDKMNEAIDNLNDTLSNFKNHHNL